MDQSDCTSNTDNIPVSSPLLVLTLSEYLAVIFLKNKKETAWYNDYVLRKWLLGYKNAIPEKDRNIYLPVQFMESSYTQYTWCKLDSKVRTLATWYTLAEQERIWKWVHLHQKNK